jgi:hypothetical protein
MSQKPIIVGTEFDKASLDTNFGNIQANFNELYAPENDIGIAGQQGFGVGICPADLLPQGMSRILGTFDIALFDEDKFTPVFLKSIDQPGY